MEVNQPIGLQGLTLYQLSNDTGNGINLWSGRLSANNGYPESYAYRAAQLFEAAPKLLGIAKKIEEACSQESSAIDLCVRMDSLIDELRAAINLATKEPTNA